MTDPWAWIAFLRLDLLIELLLAVLVGGAIGLERELSGKPAGLRTNVLICLGATLLTDVSLGLGSDGVRADEARLAAQIVSGIGFLGAGTIMQARGSITGLTSAATLWVVAAIGIAIGARHTVEAVGAAVLVLVILVPMGSFERRLAQVRRARSLTVEVARAPSSVQSVTERLLACGLSVESHQVEIQGDLLVVRFDASGPAAAWRAAGDALLSDPGVRAVRSG